MEHKVKIPKEPLALLKSTNRPATVATTDVTVADGIELISNARMALFDVHDTLNQLGILLKVYPHQETEPDAVAMLLGIEALGINKLANALKNGFMILRNFFLKLKDAVVSFFKYLFDANAKTRKQLSAAMVAYNRQKGGTAGVNTSPVVSLISYSNVLSTITMLDKLFDEAHAVYKADKKEAINTYSTALRAFGYNIEDCRVANTSNAIEFQKMTKPFLSTDSDWGWNIQTLTSASNSVLTLLSKAEKLNYIKDKINNSVKSATYTIDRFNSVGNAEAAIKLQTELNDIAMVSGYLFNCSAVFQKKVDFLAFQLVECWYTLNNVNSKS